MKMKLFILIASILFCLPDSSLALRWLSTPGEMLACTGDDVTFHWKYDTQDERVKTLINIINAQTEGTFLTYYIDDGYPKEFVEYRDRTEFIEHSQKDTKFILKSVTKNDTVGYIIQLGGIGVTNLANLKVYNKLELKPTLRVNNKPHKFHQPLNLTSNEEPTVMLLTAQSVPANISIYVDGDIVETCTRTTACVYPLSDNKVEDIGFEVDYGVCGVITEQLAVLSDETFSPVSSKADNSEVRTAEQSDEMTTFAAGYEEKELEPTLTIQNKPQTFGECFDLEVGDDCLLILTPGSGLPANISIFAEDTLVEFCPMATMAHPCGYSLKTSAPSHQNLTFLFKSGACEPIDRMITAVVTGSADSEEPQRTACSRKLKSEKWKEIALVVVVPALVICIGVFVIYHLVKCKSTKPGQKLQNSSLTWV